MTKYKLENIATLKYGKLPDKNKISAKKTKMNKYPIFTGYKVTGYYPEYIFSDSEVIVVARGVGGTGDVKLSPKKAFITNLSIVIQVDKKIVNKKYLQLLLNSMNLRRLDSGSAQSQITITHLKSFEVDLPPKDIQDKIADKISLIERKMQLNKQINANLDELMSEIFERYVTETNVFTTDSLSNIANYKNGLAMQRFRPNGADKGLPVLKIKELNQGFTDSSSDRCSSKISNDVIVKTGDIIFSWSGTLIVKIWTGTTCGLNQHLFKVTSDKYPKWFIYKWTEYYLRQFQSIAAGKATTMGHIKRSDLKQAEVKIPYKSEIDRLDKLISPIFKRYVNNILEINSLKELKNELLSKLF